MLKKQYFRQAIVFLTVLKEKFDAAEFNLKNPELIVNKESLISFAWNIKECNLIVQIPNKIQNKYKIVIKQNKIIKQENFYWLDEIYEKLLNLFQS